MLKGFALAGYRSFGDEIQYLDNLSKINLVIGQNNSGKSNVLRALVLLYAGRPSYTFNVTEDRAIGADREVPTIGVKLDSVSLSKIRAHGHAQSTVESQVGIFLAGRDGFWFFREHPGNDLQVSDRAIATTLAENRHTPSEYSGLARVLTNSQFGSIDQAIEAVAGSIAHHFPTQANSVEMIPATRSLSLGAQAGPEALYQHNGSGVVASLHEMQHPPFGQEELLDKFNTINEFLRDVTLNDTIEIEIPHDSSQILVKMDEKRLPLSSLGSGIEEIVIIAARSLGFSNQIVCVEEPELHLHPTLQRQLLKFLYEKTDNQYFITTHSAHFLDAVQCSIFHVELKDGFSTVARSMSDSDQFRICRDLGYRASDLLQSNCIVWVEGPSDRVYLNHWIGRVAPELREGLHYSIMFYGGRLLSHLSADDQEVDDFISLPKLNRHMAIVIDSDRKKARSRINETKQRVRREFEESESFVWITQGREIENYVSKKKIQVAAEKVHSKKKWVDAEQTYGQLTGMREGSRGKGKESSLDKVKVARVVCEKPLNFDQLDLKNRVDELVAFIRLSNRGA